MSPEELAQQAAYKAREVALVGRIAQDIKTMFGPPPIVLGEDPKDFDRILFELIRSRHPDDYLLKLLTYDIALETWLGRRLGRVSQKALDRKLRKIVQLQKKRAKSDAEARKNRESAEASRADFDSAPDFTAEEKRIEQLATIAEETPDDIDALSDRAELEAALDEAFREDIAFQTALDDMKSRAFFRRNISIEMWNTHRSKYLRPLSIIEHRESQRQRRENENSWLSEIAADERASQATQTKNPATQSEPPADAGASQAALIESPVAKPEPPANETANQAAPTESPPTQPELPADETASQPARTENPATQPERPTDGKPEGQAS